MAKKRTYRLTVTAYKEYVVEAKSKDEAMNIVGDEVSPMTRGFDMDTIKLDEELRTPAEVASALRHGAEDLRS